MLLEKHAPKSTKDIIGNSSAIGEIKRFITGWTRKTSRRQPLALLVHGATGSGKSTAIRLAAQELGHEVIEAHGGKASFNAYQQASMQRGIFSRKRLMLFELDEMPMKGLPELIKASEHPVICTVGDAYSLSPSARKNFKLLKFDKIGEAEMIKFLEDVCRKENIATDRRNLEQLVKLSKGDVRSLLIDIEMLKAEGTASLSDRIGYRDSEDNIFSTLKVIFKTMSLENSRIAVENSEKEPEELIRWLEENIAEEYTDMTAIATAFDYLSKADIFGSRIIRRQSWNLQKYISLGAYGTSLAKNKPSMRFPSYKYPVFARRNGAVLEKISKNLHISKRRASVYIPVLRMLAKKNSRIFDELGIDEKEAASITL